MSERVPQKHERRRFKEVILDELIASRPGRLGIHYVMPLVIEHSKRLLEFDRSELENIRSLGDHLASGRKLVAVFSHQSLGDLVPILLVSGLVQRFHGEYIRHVDLFLAKTLNEGQQGKATQAFYNEAGKPIFDRYKINPIEVVSDNDVATRGMKKSTGSILKAYRALNNTYSAIFMLPEGTMRGGRRSENGELNGMGLMSNSSRQFIGYILEKEVPAVFLPVGIHGLHEVFSPDTRNFTQQGIRNLALGFFGSSRRLGEVHIGEPFTNDDIRGSDDPAREIMLRISRLVPPEARGIFKSF